MVQTPAHKVEIKTDSSRQKNRTWLFVSLALFGLLWIFGAYYHEPWANEAHAWMLARDLDLGTLLGQSLRHEGTPGLWHLLLWVLNRSGSPYLSMQVLSGILAFGGAVLILFYSPFPLPIRVLLPLGHVMLFDLGVIARNYSLFPPVLFLLAHCWRDRNHHPARTALLIFLLSQISLHGTLLAVGILTVELVKGQRKALADHHRGWGPRGQGALLAVIVLLTSYQVWPPPDLFPDFGFRFTPFDWLTRAFFALEWAFIGGGIFPALILFFSVRWFRRTGHLALFLLPSGLVMALFVLVRMNPWHTGILWVYWVSVLWIAEDSRQETPESTSPPWRYFYQLLAAGCIVSLVFTGLSLRWDRNNPYSGGQALAEWIRENGFQDRTIHASGFYAVSVLPYFQRNLFRNWESAGGKGTWQWKGSWIQQTTPPAEVVKGNPDLVVWSTNFWPTPTLEGYDPVARFPGAVFSKFAVFEDNSLVAFVRSDLSSRVDRGGEDIVTSDGEGIPFANSMQGN